LPGEAVRKPSHRRAEPALHSKGFPGRVCWTLEVPQGTHSQESSAGKLGCGLAGDYLLCFFVGFSSIFQVRMAFSHLPALLFLMLLCWWLELAQEHTFLGPRKIPVAALCPQLSAFQSLQPLVSRQHRCLLMFTLLWDNTAPDSHMVSQHYPHVTLLESPLAQCLWCRHRPVSAAAEPGVGGRASWWEQQALPPPKASSPGRPQQCCV